EHRISRRNRCRGLRSNQWNRKPDRGLLAGIPGQPDAVQPVDELYEAGAIETQRRAAAPEVGHAEKPPCGRDERLPGGRHGRLLRGMHLAAMLLEPAEFARWQR